ncbi:helix-turn-helix transcriptional regulator [Streptomyces bambusae]|uniref:helix-turn-helix domain-containing protein n=1 Tax=Streptomyces bambusae TaxID=1550616 RepID=UPI001CFCB041|nr:helix-turn-helix transcriptional regulator [Streptomyces bambusae]MCB5168034.1 helix-turn-helix transcriptional regulator [Streptomyces bambusae]
MPHYFVPAAGGRCRCGHPAEDTRHPHPFMSRPDSPWCRCGRARRDLVHRHTPTPTLPATAYAPDTPLTLREVELMREVASGHDSHAIAARLDIEPDTLRSHLRNIATKFGVNGAASRPRLIALCLKAEVITPADIQPDPPRRPHTTT